jgi:hypothetical protein
MSYIVAAPDHQAMDRLVQAVINQHHQTLKSFTVTWMRNFDDDGDFLGWTPNANLIFKGVGDYEEDLAKWAAKTTRH